MCDVKAYAPAEGGGEELYLEGVTLIRPKDGSVYLRNLFGEERTFTGRIKEISLKENRVTLEG